MFATLGEIATRVPMLLVEQNTGTADEFGDREALVASYLGEEEVVAPHGADDGS